MSSEGLEPRRAALAALKAVLQEQRMLAHLPEPEYLPPEDRARATRLAATVLRHLGRIDQLLAPYFERRPNPPTLNILRLGAAELLIDGAEAHGVVNAAVTIAKYSHATSRGAGMINAVLRKIDTEARDRWEELPPQRIPVWMRKTIGGKWGEDSTRAIEAAHEKGAPIDLTARDGDLTIEGANRLPTGSYRLAQGQVSTLAGFSEGQFWVQDAAAALPARLLGEVAGKRVLDLCAAPGGKTMQLAAMGADVTALDISNKRMHRVRDNLSRTGLKANLVIDDALSFEAEGFDAILLDAPCSATGTIRRHPDLPFVKSAREVEDLTRLQMQMIDHASSLLTVGGVMVYCTCSILPNEGENQIKAALKRHSNLEILPIDPEEVGGDAEWASPEGGLRILPSFWADKGGIDGFYMARLQRR